MYIRVSSGQTLFATCHCYSKSLPTQCLEFWLKYGPNVLDVIKPLIKLDCIANYVMFHFTIFVVFDKNARLLLIISYQFCCLIFSLRRFNHVCTFSFLQPHKQLFSIQYCRKGQLNWILNEITNRNKQKTVNGFF